MSDVITIIRLVFLSSSSNGSSSLIICFQILWFFFCYRISLNCSVLSETSKPNSPGPGMWCATNRACNLWHSYDGGKNAYKWIETSFKRGCDGRRKKGPEGSRMCFICEICNHYSFVLSGWWGHWDLCWLSLFPHVLNIISKQILTIVSIVLYMGHFYL